MQKVGILAGEGRLPVAFAREASSRGVGIVSVSVLDECDPEIPIYCLDHRRLDVGQWDEIVTYLRDSGVTDVYMLGKVRKGLLYEGNITMDHRLERVLGSFPDRNDDSILLGLVKDLEDEGLVVKNQTSFASGLVPKKGVLTARKPEPCEWEDIRFGHTVAKAIAGLDIGQTIVVEKCAVLAVEAIEGTNEAIIRGGKLGSGKSVVIKVSKPNQDPRFDIPTVGPDTIRNMILAGASALSIDAGESFLVDRDQLIELADSAGISIVAVDPSANGQGWSL